MPGFLTSINHLSARLPHLWFSTACLRETPERRSTSLGHHFEAYARTTLQKHILVGDDKQAAFRREVRTSAITVHLV